MKQGNIQFALMLCGGIILLITLIPVTVFLVLHFGSSANQNGQYTSYNCSVALIHERNETCASVYCDVEDVESYCDESLEIYSCLVYEYFISVVNPGPDVGISSIRQTRYKQETERYLMCYYGFDISGEAELVLYEPEAYTPFYNETTLMYAIIFVCVIVIVSVFIGVLVWRRQCIDVQREE